MGDIIGGIVGGVGSVLSGQQKAKSQKYMADKAAETARLGFDYLKDDPRFSSYLDQGSRANNAIAELLLGAPAQAQPAAGAAPATPAGGVQPLGAAIRDMLQRNGALPAAGGAAGADGGAAPGAASAFDNYRNSTGYNFRLNEGMGAITGSAAARGLLNSGSTLKRLNQFGQDTASSEFSNYLSQLGALAGGGLSAGTAIGSAGSTAGASGASAISSGYGNAANSTAQGWAGLTGGLTQAGKAAAEKYPNSLGWLGN